MLLYLPCHFKSSPHKFRVPLGFEHVPGFGLAEEPFAFQFLRLFIVRVDL
jgi:hypothetical protein